MKNFYVLTLTLSLVFSMTALYAQQGVAINTDNSNPDPSAILDVKSTDKGMLVPRMTSAQRILISSPATGLLVYDNTTNSFWFYDGTVWTELTGESPFQHTGTLVSPNGSIVNETTDDFVFGSPQLDDDGNANHDRRFFFDKSQGSFRAGMVTGTEWDAASIGRRSTAFGAGTRATANETMAFGANTTASGPASTAWGNSSSATANYATAWGNATISSSNSSTAWGFNTTANNNQSTAWGNGTTASSNQATAFGQNTTASANNATAMGFNTEAYSYGETVLGTNSTVYTPLARTSYNAADRVFTVGNGASVATPSDALVILKNGNTTINGQLTLSDGANPFTLPNADGTVGQVLTTDGAGNVSWAAGAAGSGDITDVTAGTGLTGGGTTGAVTLNVDANNGLTTNADDIVLGGALNQATTISAGAFNMNVNLDGAGAFHVQDGGVNHFSVDASGDSHFGSDVYWRSANTGGTIVAQLFDSGAGGVFDVYRNGAVQHRLNSVGNTTFNEQSTATDFRVESDANTHMLFVDGGANAVGIGTNSPSSKLHVGGTGATGLSINSDSPSSTSKIELGTGSTGNRFAYIDLTGDDTYSDYGLRIMRSNGGQNTVSSLTHRGTGLFRFSAVEATSLTFSTANTERMRVAANGNVGIGTNAPSQLLDVAGTATINTLNINGNYTLPNIDGTANQVLSTDGAGNVSWTAAGSGDITDVTAGTGLTDGGTTGAVTLNVDANNGLTTNADDIVLGGTLNQNTTINNDAFDMTINLDGTGDFHVQDAGVNHFSITDGGDIDFGGDVNFRDENTGSSLLARVVDVGGVHGLLDVYANGLIQHRLHSIGTSVFNEQGLMNSDFRVESVANTHMLFVDATANHVGIGIATPLAKLHVGGFVRSEGLAGGGDQMVYVNDNGLLLAQALPAAGWELTGNAGTTNGTDFIGTTDNVALDFRTNNIIRATLTTEGKLEILNTGESVFIGEGAGAGDDLSTNQNTFIGHQAATALTTAERNAAVGKDAMLATTTGGNNAAIGWQSLQSNTTGRNNTALGYNAFRTGTAHINSTAVGSNSAITASNQVRVGNTAVTSIGGVVNWTNVSDARFKTNVQENVAGLDFINKLRPVTYNMDMDAIAQRLDIDEEYRDKDAEALKAAQLQTGFIAQEVEAAAKESGYNFSGVDAPKNENDHYGLRYAEFTVPLVKAVQELSAENKELKEQVKDLEEKQAEIDALKVRVQELEQMQNEIKELKTLLNNQ